jgi:hypothetical protein
MSDASSKDGPPRGAAWQRRGNTAQWISAVAACVALTGFLLQINAIRANSREASARQLYGSYMDAALKYPEFLAPDYAAIKSNPTRLAQYRWFVLYFLFAYDEVFHSVGEEGWVPAFRGELRPHLPMLCEWAGTTFPHGYYARTVEIVRAEVQAAKQTVPECANAKL